MHIYIYTHTLSVSVAPPWHCCRFSGMRIVQRTSFQLCSLASKSGLSVLQHQVPQCHCRPRCCLDRLPCNICKVHRCRPSAPCCHANDMNGWGKGVVWNCLELGRSTHQMPRRETLSLLTLQLWEAFPWHDNYHHNWIQESEAIEVIWHLRGRRREQH